MQFRCVVQPLEHCNVWVGSKIVLVDMWIRKLREHLVVAGVGKSESVGPPRDTLFFLITKNLPLMCDCLPHEGEHRFSALGRSCPPEVMPQGVDILHASVFLVHERTIRPFEDLLPSQPVNHDHKNIPCLEFRWGFTLATNV